MSKNCIKSISTEEFVSLKNAENTEKFYKCKTEYKTYLKSLDKKALEVEWSQNLDLLDSLKYTYNFIKGYYFTDIFNFAKYIENDELYCSVQEYVVSVNPKENLERISKSLKSMSDYLDDYLKDILKFKSKYPSRAFLGGICADMSSGKWHHTSTKKDLFVETYNIAYECYCFFDELDALYRMFTGNYYIDMLLLDPSKVPAKNKKQIESFPSVIKGEKPEDRITYYATSESIFELAEGHIF